MAEREPGWYWVRRIVDGPWRPMRWYFSRDGEEFWAGSRLGERFAEIGPRIYPPGEDPVRNELVAVVRNFVEAADVAGISNLPIERARAALAKADAR